MGCQLRNLDEIRVKKHWIHNLYEFGIQILHRIKRIALYIKHELTTLAKPQKNSQAYVKKQQTQMRPGDMVRVRSKQEIQSMLDPWGKYKGCLFVGRMYEYCDKTYPIFKEVDFFYDEAKQKMCKCKDIVLLNGVLCNGRQKLYLEDCDRSCFYFWHKDWLEKVEDGEGL
jgi:hypothetical protein